MHSLLRKHVPSSIRRRARAIRETLHLCRRGLDEFRLSTAHGALRSSADLNRSQKLDLNLHFQHREKAEVAFTVASSWYGGDYMEFGAHDLTTFRNMLTAYDVCCLDQRFPDTRFYAFDIFGSLANASREALESIAPIEGDHQYFANFMTEGDLLERHLQYVRDHGLFEERCTLVQGLFEDTLTEERRVRYRDSGRRIGFAFVDVNIWPSYKSVLEFIYPLMAENSYIYMDEFFQNSAVLVEMEEFVARLRDERGIGVHYMRNAAGFGGLLRLYSLTAPEPRLKLSL